MYAYKNLSVNDFSQLAEQIFEYSIRCTFTEFAVGRYLASQKFTKKHWRSLKVKALTSGTSGIANLDFEIFDILCWSQYLNTIDIENLNRKLWMYVTVGVNKWKKVALIENSFSVVITLLWLINIFYAIHIYWICIETRICGLI